jgi:putative restriction endonuclease
MDRPLGCVAVVEPVFSAPDEWVPAPADWHPTIVSGAGYDVEPGEGVRLWAARLERAATRRAVPRGRLRPPPRSGTAARR